MQINAQMVKELRESTGAGMMACKQALVESSGDLDKAVELLRKKGLAAAEKKAGRAAAEGAVGSYIHAGGKIGVLVEVNCETDFVARTEDFQALVRDLAMHIAAAEPRFARREEVTEEILAKEREIFRAQALESGKPEQVVDKIVDGKMEKFYSQSVLLDQAFIKDPDKTVHQLVTEAVAKMGENIQVRRFSRFKLGEGLARREDDFAAEVAAQMG
ncbi:MAG: translation elongation factor Ts [Acidobacteriota bacterium]|nr:translation elongation factor Ts [Acidobacteriota bacterium]MDH3525167.1 translation elongation factor Ts [Acidobacteriota bacterium]